MNWRTGGIAALLAALIGAASLGHAQTKPVPMNGVFGSNGIDAALAKDHVNQYVSICGRVADVSNNVLTLGSSAWVFIPKTLDAAPYLGTVVCAHGTVYIRDTGNGGLRVPSIDVTAADQIVTIGGQGPYRPQTHCRACEREQPNGTCRQVRACM